MKRKHPLCGNLTIQKYIDLVLDKKKRCLEKNSVIKTARAQLKINKNILRIHYNEFYTFIQELINN